MAIQRAVYLRVALLLIILWGLWTVRLGAKFYGEQDSFRTWVPAAVRNYDIYGYDNIGLTIVRDGYERELDELYRYSHHPPLLVWLPALVTKVAGFNEVSIRIVFPFAMMIAAAAFYVLVRRLHNREMAFWATAFFGVTPFITYFQSSYGHDPLGFMAFLLFAAIFVAWLRSPTVKQFLALAGCAILAVWTAWPAVIFVGTLGVVGMLIANWRQRIGIVILGMVSVIALVTMLGLYELWWGGATESLLDSFRWRSSSSTLYLDSPSASLPQWFIHNMGHILVLGTIGLFALAVMGLFYLKGRGRKHANVLTAALFVAAILYFLMFRNATYIHTYYKAFLIPAFAISAAAAVLYGRDSERLRFSRPLTDGLILVCVAQSIYMLFLLVGSTSQPSVTTVVDFLNSEETLPGQVVVTFVGVNTGTEQAVEYYTRRGVDWNILLPDLEIDEGEETLYIFCNENQNYVRNYFQELPEQMELDDYCTAYWLRALP